ncbi:MAG: DUF2147 domain-containing protein, partial [Candidatus Hydrogenedentales bacterium]
MTGFKIAALFVAVAFVGSGALAQDVPADRLVGKWYTEENESVVEVYQARSQDGQQRYYGKIVWLAEPIYEEDDPEAGKPKRNRESSEPDEQDDPILGLQVLTGFLYNA